MANSWFRMYAEFANDPKVQMLSETDQRRYIMLLCIRCNGDVTLHDSEVAFQLRISNAEWLVTKAILAAKNLVTDDNKPTAWDKRQYSSDSSVERVRKHRGQKKASGNADVTLQKQKSNAVDSDTDTDTEQKEQKKRAPRFDAQAHLVDLGVDASVSADWLSHRKAKKATVTKTVIDGIKSEAAKARIALSDALAMCCQRGWVGFKAEWMTVENTAPQTRKTQHQLNQAGVANAIFGYLDQPARNERMIAGEVVA